MEAATPKIDGRSAADIAAELRSLLATSLGLPSAEAGDRVSATAPFPSPSGPGEALVRIVAHLAATAVDRLDRTPDKAFLAFLNLIGVAPQPPQPARVPLTFTLTRGATVDARVPAGTQVGAAAVGGEIDPPVYEMAGDLFLTAAELVAACVHDPSLDTWRDLSSILGTRSRVAGRGLDAFIGDAVDRRLWIAHGMFAGAGPRTVTVTATADPDGALPDIDWASWDGVALRTLTSTPSKDGGFDLALDVSVPVSAAATRDGGPGPSGAWLVGRLRRSPAGDGRDPSWDRRIVGLEPAVALSTGMADLPADAVFNEGVPVDASKHFLPFGATPKLGDACLVSCERAFAPAGPGGEHVIRLTFAAEGPGSPAGSTVAGGDPRPTLAWDYWNGSAWSPIGPSGDAGARAAESVGAEFGLSSGPAPDAADAARVGSRTALPGSPTVTFHRPADWARSIVGTSTGHWLRVRIAAGDYGREAGYAPTDGGASYALTPATWRPPSFRALTVGYAYRSSPVRPDSVSLETPGGFDDIETARADVLAEGETDPSRPGGGPALHLAFDRPGAATAFGDGPVSLYVGLDEITSEELGRAVASGVADPPVVSWDYATAEGWRPLGVEDGTAGFTRSGIVAFVGPADLARRRTFGRTAFWLRGRRGGGASAVPPRINRLVTNTGWASHATRFAGEALGSGTAEPGQVFRTGHVPVLAGQAVEVAETEMPGTAALATLRAEEGPDCAAADATGSVPRVWVRWHEVPDFYGSGPDDRHYTIDRANGLITFGGNRRGYTVPRGAGNVRVSYATGGGTVGDRPAGAVTQLKSAIPYVASVVNVVPAGGGADAETVDAVLRRGPATLRHRGRAVTISDYEDLAFEASPAVARVRGIPSRGDDVSARVELIVVPRDAASRPVPSLELLQRVRDRVSAATPPTVELAVCGPGWASVSVAAEVVPVSLDRAVAVRVAVQARLDAFLHPLTGGLDGAGWAFGHSPSRSDFYAVIQAVSGVDHVRALTVAVRPEGAGLDGHTLVSSGTHDVTVAGTT